jgi:thiamine biosynthesis protein ThiS
VVELDGEIVAPADLDTRRVQAAARLEIVHFVGGG